MNKQVTIYNNSTLTQDKISNTQLSTYALLGPFYSIKTRDLNIILLTRFKGIQAARAAFIVLLHLNHYNRNIQNDLKTMYGFSFGVISKLLKTLTELGLIRPVNCKRPTNIGKHVPLIAYVITVEGKEKVQHLNELLLSKINKLKK